MPQNDAHAATEIPGYRDLVCRIAADGTKTKAEREADAPVTPAAVRAAKEYCCGPCHRILAPTRPGCKRCNCFEDAWALVQIIASAYAEQEEMTMNDPETKLRAIRKLLAHMDPDIRVASVLHPDELEAMRSEFGDLLDAHESFHGPMEPRWPSEADIAADAIDRYPREGAKP